MILQTVFVALGLFAVSAMTGPEVAADEPKPVQVMVLGTWHFDNPGLDLVNVEAEDVRSEKRQAELQAIASALAEFRPTKIMVERLSKTPDFLDEGFNRFSPADLSEQRDERVQIGYRLARGLGHENVYAIDEQSTDGKPDYFPFAKVLEYAQLHGQMPKLQQGIANVEAEKKAFLDKQARTHLAALLAEENEPSDWKAGIGGYYELLGIGDEQVQPGAELNAYWYMRNAKIFTKLMKVSQPGDRLLVVFGISHAYWLRHFASEVNGFENVDPRPYLQRAAAVRP